MFMFFIFSIFMQRNKYHKDNCENVGMIVECVLFKYEREMSAK